MRLLDEVPRSPVVDDYGGVLPRHDGYVGVPSRQRYVFPPLDLGVRGTAAADSIHPKCVRGTIRFLLPNYRWAYGGQSWLLKPFAAPTPPPRMVLMSSALFM